MWLTVPVNVNHGKAINEVKVDNSFNWIKKHKKSIQINYSKSDFFYQYWDVIESIYDRTYDLLFDIDSTIIKYIMKKFKIEPKIALSSELDISGKGSDRILNICHALNADIYLSGKGGKNYLNLDEFRKYNIEVQFQNFQHPVYQQAYKPFIPNMSIIDLLFNEGDRSIEILKNSSNF